MVYIHQAGNYMFKVNNRHTRARCGIYSKLTIKIPEQRLLVSLLLTLNIFTPCSSVSIVNFGHVDASWVVYSWWQFRYWSIRITYKMFLKWIESFLNVWFVPSKIAVFYLSQAYATAKSSFLRRLYIIPFLTLQVDLRSFIFLFN